MRHLGLTSRDDFVHHLLRQFASEADFRRIFEICEKIKIMLRAFSPPAPFRKSFFFSAIRALFRFVQSSEGRYSTLRSIFDCRFAPKTPAKPRFRRLSTSIDFATRANDFLDDGFTLSRLPQHASTFDRYRGPF